MLEIKRHRIEISKRLPTNVDYHIANFYGIDVLILNEQDAFATKLLAATKRKKIAYRDFYDIYFYLKKGIQPNRRLVETETKMNFGKYIDYLIKFAKRTITSRTILHGLGELVDNKQKLWIKNNLKNELIRRLTFMAS